MKAFSFSVFEAVFASYIGKDLLEINFFFSLWPYIEVGHNTSTMKGLNRWSLPPKLRKTTDSLSHNPFLISRTYCYELLGSHKSFEELVKRKKYLVLRVCPTLVQ